MTEVLPHVAMAGPRKRDSFYTSSQVHHRHSLDNDGSSTESKIRISNDHQSTQKPPLISPSSPPSRKDALDLGKDNKQDHSQNHLHHHHHHHHDHAKAKPPTWAQYLAQRQLKFPLRLLATVALAHSLPALRPYTSKLLYIQYVTPDGWATIGKDDAYFVSLWVVILVFTRAALMEYILLPTAQYLGINTKKAKIRFAEQGWMLFYYLTAWVIGMYLLEQSEYSRSIQALWIGWPHYKMHVGLKAYYLVQLACWISQIYVLNVEERRKDHVQMFTHHIVTCFLVTGSYYYYYTRVGHVILILMDVVDAMLSTAKMLKYLGFNQACDVAFGVFLVGWITCRHGLYNYITWSAIAEVGDIIEKKCYYTPDGGRCFTSTVQFVFVALLVALQIITLIWLYMIMGVVVKILKGGSAEDNRSDDESDDEDEDEHDE